MLVGAEETHVLGHARDNVPDLSVALLGIVPVHKHQTVLSGTEWIGVDVVVAQIAQCIIDAIRVFYLSRTNRDVIGQHDEKLEHLACLYRALLRNESGHILVVL